MAGGLQTRGGAEVSMADLSDGLILPPEGAVREAGALGQ